MKIKAVLVDKFSKPLSKMEYELRKANSLANSTSSILNYWPAGIQRAISKTKELQSEFKKNNSLVDDFGKKLKGIFAAYGGVMTIRAVIETSDTITGAENRLNYANGGDTAATETAMDKMYAASLSSRSNYSNMLSNVGKSMALAGDSFQGNVDNAIRFQEVMAKSYAVGGASAAEQSSSMYQMIQALGSGILQGDELRSVREGAPLAYKAIEEFAQGVYKTDESLKDLASQGKITSDIVVAAMMQAGDNIDEAFENTNMTIAQAFTNMKTVAVNSFRPIQDTINEFLNSDKGEKFLNGITVGIQILINVLGALVTLFVNAATWIVDNWSWVQWIVYAVGFAIMWLVGVVILQALWKAVIKIGASSALAWWPWLLAISVVIAAIIYLANTASDMCDFIVNLLLWLATIAVGVMTLIMIYSWITTGGITLGWQLMMLFIIAVLALIAAIALKYISQIAGFFNGLGSAISAICNNIAAWWHNMLAGMKYMFWNWVDGIISDFKPLLEAINAGLELIGKDPIDIDFAANKASAAKNSIKSYESVSDAFSSGYASGYAWGEGVKTKINETGAGLKNKLANANPLSEFSGMLSADALANDPANQLATSNFDPEELGKGVGNIDDNTGKIKDSMDLTQEDLEYLRKTADMEWKKEFTTANIIVDMKNNNTINNPGDLDSWFGVLSDKLYEKLGMVADGVYT